MPLPLSFMFVPSPRLTRLGFVRDWMGRGCDEWHNPSIYLIVPLVGQFVIFRMRYRRIEGAEHAYASTNGNITDGIYHRNCPICIEIWGER